MIEFYATSLDNARDVLEFLVLTVAAGMVGALTAELFVERGSKRKETGILVLPSRWRNSIRVGFLAAIPVGGMAALIASPLFAPVQEVAAVAPSTDTTREYDVVGQLVLGLIAGLASTAFLQAVRERFVALVTADRMATALGAVKEQVDATLRTLPDDDQADENVETARQSLMTARTRIQEELNPA